MSARTDAGEPARPHTGRRRNDQAQTAILQATRQLLRTRPYREVTMEAIAKAARVGKQTLYRWWGSRADVILDSLLEESHNIAARQSPAGLLQERLYEFLCDTLHAIEGDKEAAGLGPVLRALMAESQADDDIRQRFRDGFTASRRADLRAVLQSAIEDGASPSEADVEVLIDMAYGAVWYRLLLGHGPLDCALAREIADYLALALRWP